MTEEQLPAPAPLDDAFAAECRRAAEQIDAALAATGAAQISAAGKAVPPVASLRDRVIIARRAEPPSPGRDAALAKLNIALSLVVSAGYPEGPSQRPYLEQAREILLALARQVQHQD